MESFEKYRRKALWIGPLLVALLVTGCAGITPYKPRDYRQEGLESGFYSGSEGEFVIYRKVDKPEAGKKPDETADREQQKIGNEEKKEESQSGEKAP